MEIDLAAAVANEPYLAGLFDHLRGSLRPTMVEAGGCDGYHTRVFQQAVPGLRQVVLEADPRNVDLLRKNVNWGPACTLHPFALAGDTAIVDFHLATPEPNGAIGSSSLSAFTPALTESHPWLHEERVIRVMGYRLDDLLPMVEVDHVDLLWLDVQGAERAVLQGMVGCWREVHRVFTEHDSGYVDSTTLEEIKAQLNGMSRRVFNQVDAWALEAEYGPNALFVNRAFE